MNCPDCANRLRGDGSCCDYCGWTLFGGGDDPRLPSHGSREQIERETVRRSVRRTVAILDQAGTMLREAIAAISTFPDTAANQALHKTAAEIEVQVRALEAQVRWARIAPGL